LQIRQHHDIGIGRHTIAMLAAKKRKIVIFQHCTTTTRAQQTEMQIGAMIQDEADGVVVGVVVVGGCSDG
jgi:hypothetical protein